MTAYNVPFCDWLTTAYSTVQESPLSDLEAFLPVAGLFPESAPASRKIFWCFLDSVPSKTFAHKCLLVHPYGDGLIVTVYGGGLDYFREHNNGQFFQELVGILGSYRHNITRCDVSMDLDIDTPDFFMDFLPLVRDGYFALRRDSLPVTRIINVRDDGYETGTVYIGKDTAARAKATIYDKQLEQLQRAHKRIPPTTRIEFQLKKEFGVSLWDVMKPASLFWELAYPKILKHKPADIEPWVKREGYFRNPVPRTYSEINHRENLKRLVYDSPVIPGWVKYCDKHLGPESRQYLIRLISQLISNPVMGIV